MVIRLLTAPRSHSILMAILVLGQCHPQNSFNDSQCWLALFNWVDSQSWLCIVWESACTHHRSRYMKYTDSLGLGYMPTLSQRVAFTFWIEDWEWWWGSWRWTEINDGGGGPFGKTGTLKQKTYNGQVRTVGIHNKTNKKEIQVLKNRCF